MRRGGDFFVLVALLTLLAIGLLLMLLPAGASAGGASVFEDGPRGRSVLFEVLRELDFEVSAWNEEPGALPSDGSLLVMHDVPGLPPGYEGRTVATDATSDDDEPAQDEAGVDEADEGGEAPAVTRSARAPISPSTSRRRRHPEHYRRFLEDGGTILLTASDGALEHVHEQWGLDPDGDIVFEARRPDPADEADEADQGDSADPLELPYLDDAPEDEEDASETAPARVVWPDGTRTDTSWQPSGAFDPPPLGSDLETLLQDAEGNPLVLSLPVGQGRLVLLAPDDDFLSNGEIDEPGNALTFVRLVENLDVRGPLRFDEYALGGWIPASKIELAFAPAAAPLSLHLVLLLVVVVWTSAWSREFPRDPVALAPVSALVRAEGFAGLVGRAGRFGLLAGMLRRGVLRRLAERVGHRVDGAHGVGAAPSARATADGATVRAVLARLIPESDPKERARAERLFAADDVTSRADLERLALELDELERTLLAPTPETTKR